MLGLLALTLAHAGDLDTEASVDLLHARSTSAEAGAGSPELLAATELGLRLRLDLHELEDRLELGVDYRGREPVGGALSNDPRRLLYSGELRYALVEDRLTAGLGRFVAPATVLTPVDGLRLSWTPKDWELSAYGGRRGFTQSLRNLPLDAMLPAAGLSVAFRGERLHWLTLAGYSVDELVLLTARTERVGGWNGMTSVSAIPTDSVRVGGQLAMTQQASYLLGPTWSDLSVEVEALDLWRGAVWSDWEIREWLELGGDVLHQRVGVWGAGSVDGAGVEVALQEPSFTDLRIEGGVGTWKHGWIRPEARYRVRPDRREIRWGGTAEFTDLGTEGPFVTGKLFVEELSAVAPDRLLWSASAGWDRDGLDAELGARFLEREAGPFSGRRVNGSAGEDLAPFVLEAQKNAFVRAFHAGERWFGGLDLEKSLVDSELRLFVQLGALAEVGW